MYAISNLYADNKDNPSLLFYIATAVIFGCCTLHRALTVLAQRHIHHIQPTLFTSLMMASSLETESPPWLLSLSSLFMILIHCFML